MDLLIRNLTWLIEITTSLMSELIDKIASFDLDIDKDKLMRFQLDRINHEMASQERSFKHVFANRLAS